MVESFTVGGPLARRYHLSRVNPIAMKSCPRCTYPLEEITHKEVELDHCRRCGGTFLEPEGGSEVFGPFVDPAVWADSEIAPDLGRW